MKLLQQLYFINSPSDKEGDLSKFVQEQLHAIGITDFKLLDNQIYRITKDTPMIAAHLDHITYKPVTKLFYNKKDNTICGDDVIGADDKNGVWIALNLLKQFKDLSFIFSTNEEHGGKIHEVFDLLKDKDGELFNSIKYCIVFDRRGASDIIGVENNYCNKDLEDDLVILGTKYGYKPSSGVWSDCNTIRKFVPCVNLSCGYYLAHTNKEYTNITELNNALAFGEAIFKTITKTYERTILPKVYTYTTYNSKYYNRYSANYSSIAWNDIQSDAEAYSNTVLYCIFCGEYFYENEQIDKDKCPNCKSSVIEKVGYAYEEYEDVDIPQSNILEYYYCQHCDTYTDIDDSIIGLEDSPEMCRQCGNIKLYFREIVDKDDRCKACPDYISKVCDDSCCKSCTFFDKKADLPF